MYRTHRLVIALAVLLMTTLSACARPAPQQGDSGVPQEPGEQQSDREQKTRGPAPREGPQVENESEIDAAHKRAVELFPARTEGKGAQLLEPTEVTPEGVKVYDLEAKVVQWEVEPGVRREAWTFGGTVPGPVIRVTEGDRVRIRLKNSLPESTSLHPHGMENTGDDNKYDGVSYLNTEPTKPGETSVYEFTAYPPGTHMYHSHHDSTKQVALGMLGPLIVDPKDPTDWPQADKEYVWVINDGPLGYTINGKSFPATEPIVVKQGTKVLVRWLNEGAMMHPMHLHGPAMSIVARDGHLLPEPQKLDVLTVHPGERYDVLLDTSKPGTWAWHCHVLPHAEGEQGLYGLTTVVTVEPAS